MVASSEQCRRHVSGAAAAVPSFSDDGVVRAVLKALGCVGDDKRTGTKAPMVSRKRSVSLFRNGDIWEGVAFVLVKP